MRSVARWVLALAPPRGGDGVMAERNRGQTTGQRDRTARAGGLGINPGVGHIDREEDWVGYDAFLGDHQSTSGRSKDSGIGGTEAGSRYGRGLAATAETAGKRDAGVSGLGASAQPCSFNPEDLRPRRDGDTMLRRPESAATSDYYRGYSAAWDYCSRAQDWNAANGLNRMKSATLLGIFALAILLSAVGGFVLGRATG